MSNLKTTLESLSAEFATSVLRAIRAASLEDLVAESGSGSAPRAAAKPAGRGRPGRPPKAAAPAPAPVAAAPAAKAAGRKAGGRRRLARRSPADITNVVDQIVALLTRRNEGLRSEDIRSELNLAANEMPRPLAEGLKTKRIVKEGEKRATVYFVKGASGKKK